MRGEGKRATARRKGREEGDREEGKKVGSADHRRRKKEVSG